METKNVIPWKKGIRGIFGFTLVELIVVITILVILGTIAFINLGGYSGSARDSSRVSDMTNIAQGLELALVRNGTVPVPEAGSITVSASGVVIGYQGYAGGSVLSAIKMSEAKDPLDKKYYTYSTNVAYTKYEMLGLMEDPGTLTSADSPFISTAYAGYETRTPATRGSSLGVLLGNTGASLNVPVQENYSVGSFTGVDLVKTTTLSGYTMVFSKNDSTASIATSGTGAYTGSLFTFAYNKRDDLLSNKALASNDSSLVGYWDMETLSGTLLKDLSWYWNHGTCYNSGTIAACGWASGWPQFVEGNGKSGKSMSFDGASGFIRIADSTSLRTTNDWTRMIMVKSNTVPWWDGAVHDIFSQRNTTDKFLIRVDNTGTWNFYYPNTLSVFDHLSTPQNTSTWQLFCFVKLGTSVKFYINGSLVTSTNNIINFPNDNGEMILWKTYAGYGAYFSGTIDEVHIYNRALSDSEISALYQATK